MKDDILIIGEHHRKAAGQIIPLILPGIKNKPGKYLVTVAGESGAGKSEIASAMANMLDKANINTYIIQQDDYFILPPVTNAEKRVQDIAWVGPGEVKIDLLNRQIKEILKGKSVIEKPLVIFLENFITEEKIDISTYRVIIFEGTYTSLLENIDCRIFIDRDYMDTSEDRLRRNREKQDAYLEKILKIEHNIISSHLELADIIITKNFDVTKP
ncbi:MAG: hypothetical protein K0B08_09460 [Bacteroidales bacterium]|nr:hypothetical protein [Bacteroidales bacterium]